MSNSNFQSVSYSSSSFSSSSTDEQGNVQTSGTRNATYSGREVPMLESNGGSGSGSAGADRMIGTGNNRVEDVTESEADKLYRERMEEEYAKREGGA